MIIGFIQLLLSTSIALVASLAKLRRDDDEAISLFGFYVIMASISLALLTVSKTIIENHEQVLNEFRISDTGVDLAVTANVTGVYPSDNLEARSSSTLRLSLVFPGEGAWTFTLVPSSGFLQEGYSRGAVVTRRLFLTQKVEQSRGGQFKLLWDLAGKEATILRAPRFLFSDFSVGDRIARWRTNANLTVMGHQFEPKDQNAARLVYNFEGLNQESLLENSEFSAL